MLPLAPPPRRRLHAGTSPGNLAGRIAGYINKLPAGLSEGQHRDDYGFQLAAFLVRDPALADAEALPWMELWDARNTVPKGTDRLRELLGNAWAYGRRPVGCGRDRTAAGPDARVSVTPAGRPGHYILRCRLEVR